MFSFLRKNSYGVFIDKYSLFGNQLKRTKITTNFVEELSKALNPQIVSVKDSLLKTYGKDEGHFAAAPPEVVVLPTCTDDVVKAVKLCDTHNVPIVPFGAGTGLEGGVCAINGGLCLDLRNMNNILEVNADDFDCRVQPGVDWRTLNSYLRDTGLWFTVDPGASASVGGMASTGASGTNAVRYGTMKENVLNLEVVLPNGDIINTSGKQTRSKKSVAGYNLTNLFVGSEGTLGVITGLTLKLNPIPESFFAIVSSFPSIKAATETTIQTLQSCVPVTKIELLDEVSMKASHLYHKSDLPVAPTLFVEFNGSKSDTEQQSVLFKDIAESNGCTFFKSTSNIEERNKLWKARHEMYYACMALKPNCSGLTTDVCVPISKLTDIILWSHEHLEKMNILGPIIGHVGDGNFHIFALISTEEDKKQILQFANQLSECALSLGGTCTGEHGIGMGKKHLLMRQFNNETITLMKTLKRAVDPKNLMNPGKVFDF